MLKNIRKRTEGFTIIEVLIVLAIAGLILLIVFLAVPALQRNSRNTQRKNDIAAILGGITEYSNNHAGVLPPDFDAIKDNIKLGFYTASDVTLTNNASATSQENPTNEGTVKIHTYSKCDTNGEDAIATGASSRNVVALYTVETSGTGQKVCQEN